MACSRSALRQFWKVFGALPRRERERRRGHPASFTSDCTTSGCQKSSSTLPPDGLDSAPEDPVALGQLHCTVELELVCSDLFSRTSTELCLGVGSRKLVGLEGSDPRPYEEVGDQGRGSEARRHGGAYEQFPHSQEQTSLPWWIAFCRDLDDAPPRQKTEPVFTLSLMEKLLCRVRSSGTKYPGAESCMSPRAYKLYPFCGNLCRLELSFPF